MQTKHVTFFALTAKSTTGEPAGRRRPNTRQNVLNSGLKIAIVMLAMVATAIGAWARQPFDATAFAQAQAAGKTILVDVYASWCPTCRQQQPIITRLQTERPDLVVFTVDFDRSKDVLKRFRAQFQSTLIVFKGKEEVGRSTGDTSTESIGALVAKGF
jgi:thiol-disulfide isomerase/thioredoxin